MTNPRQNVISKLDSRLEHFLKAYAVKRLDQLKVSDKINSLREITFSNKEQYRQMDNRLAELESWFKENDGLLSGKILTKEMIQQLEECADQIGAYSRGKFGHSDKQAILFNRKQAAGVAATANLFVNRIAGVLAESGAHLVTSPVKPPEIDLTEPKSAESGVDNREIMDQLKNSIDYQSKMLDYYRQTGQHPFTAVDSLLKALEKSPDLKVNHLAASMLYYMKLKGYKVGPYVERLRKVGNRKNG